MMKSCGGAFMINVAYTNEGIVFQPDSHEEAMVLRECFTALAPYHQKDDFSWHRLVTRSEEPIEEMNPIKGLKYWNLVLEPQTAAKVQKVLHSKRKAFRRRVRTITEWMDTPEFKKARKRVVELFGKPLKDGRVLFPYQIDLAALIVCTKRILNAWEMGLGKTLSTIVGLASDPTNKLNLIITMKRNINDWVKEFELLDYKEGQDYIILNSPADMKRTDVRFHLVSYENWSGERIVYRPKVHMECPDCHSGPGLFRLDMQYCTVCRKKAGPILNDKQKVARWSEKDLPTHCPDCGAEWKKGRTVCGADRIFRHNGLVEQRKCNYSVIERKIPSLSYYYHRGYDAVAVDEAHYIKNIDTQRARSVLRVRARTRVLLTGTPAENEVSDLYWLLGWLTGFSSCFEDPIEHKPFQGYGKVGFENFRTYYGGGSKRRVFDVDSVEARVGHHQELWRLLDTVMVRKKKTDEDVKHCIAVPEPNQIRYHLDLMPAERKLYDKLVEQFREWYEEELLKKREATQKGISYKINTIEICSWMDKLRKAASCPWIFPEYDAMSGRTTAKLKYLENRVKDYVRRGQKVLLFSGHKETIEQLKLVLDEIIPGRFAEYIHGDVPIEYRWDILRKFQDPHDPLSILIMSHRTGAESYTLTEAKAVFIVDLDFNGKKIEQCFSRAVRLGQKDVVDVHWLLGINTIDVNMHGVVLSKISGVNLAIDRQELDFTELASQFDGDSKSASHIIDYEEFAREMLKGGTKRNEIAPSSAQLA
jgi:hypothetical protein